MLVTHDANIMLTKLVNVSVEKRLVTTVFNTWLVIPKAAVSDMCEYAISFSVTLMTLLSDRRPFT